MSFFLVCDPRGSFSLPYDEPVDASNFTNLWSENGDGLSTITEKGQINETTTKSSQYFKFWTDEDDFIKSGSLAEIEVSKNGKKISAIRARKVYTVNVSV